MSDRLLSASLACCLAAAALSLLLAWPASAEIGNCDVSGTKGAYHIDPMVPGELTVRANLPAPGWCATCPAASRTDMRSKHSNKRSALSSENCSVTRLMAQTWR